VRKTIENLRLKYAVGFLRQSQTCRLSGT
jgi:hypothetical protein